MRISPRIIGQANNILAEVVYDSDNKKDENYIEVDI
jgi:hypothetical protein